MNWPAPDPSSPFFLTGPALISFSGGRTSAYMLWRILRAHGGVLPPHVYVVFANTGKERPETLRFIHECAVRWSVTVYWIEWRGRRGESSSRFERVGFNSASRRGEPFRALIIDKGYLPNAIMRFCTAELKIEAMKHFMLSLDYERWINVVGLRADEMPRVMKQVLRNLSGKERWRSACPLALAGVTKRVIHKHWLGRNADGRDRRYPLPQGFDLGLLDHEGNCDDCLLKGWDVLIYQEQQNPGELDWWIESEAIVAARGGKASGAQFVTEYSYAQIQAAARSSPPLALPPSPDRDAECGVSCIADADEDFDDGAVAWLMEQLRKVAETPLPAPVPRLPQPPAVGDLFG